MNPDTETGRKSKGQNLAQDPHDLELIGKNAPNVHADAGTLGGNDAPQRGSRPSQHQPFDIKYKGHDQQHGQGHIAEFLMDVLDDKAMVCQTDWELIRKPRRKDRPDLYQSPTIDAKKRQSDQSQSPSGHLI